MATKRQIAANRRNSLKSTGPQTPEGKAASAKNSFQHGMYSQDILLFHEDFEGYEVFRTHLFTDQQPETAAEMILIEQVLQSYFMARRALTMMGDCENNAIHGAKPAVFTTPILMKLKIQNDRIAFRALQALQQIKAARIQAAAAQQSAQGSTAKSFKVQVLPKNGFVPPQYPDAPACFREVPYSPQYSESPPPKNF